MKGCKPDGVFSSVYPKRPNWFPDYFKSIFKFSFLFYTDFYGQHILHKYGKKLSFFLFENWSWRILFYFFSMYSIKRSKPDTLRLLADCRTQ